MEPIDSERFKKAKDEAEAHYKTIGEVYCPYFQEKVVFNAKRRMLHNGRPETD